MTEHDNTRRDLLRIAGTTTLFGFGTTTVSAESSEAQSPSDSHTLPYDIVVLNNSGQRFHISIAVHRKTGSDEKTVFTQNNELDPAAKHQARLGLSKGTYVIEVTRGDSTTTTTWHVPEDGIPEWNAVSVSMTPSNEIKIQEIEV